MRETASRSQRLTCRLTAARLLVSICGVWLASAMAASAATDFSDYSVFGSASSTQVSTIKIGATTDTESVITANTAASGDDITGIDDEDGVTLPASIVAGTSGSLTINVTNTSGATVYLNAWIDFNGNGVLTDTGEQVATNTTIATGTSAANKTVNFTVPATAIIGTVGVRVRLTSTSTPGSTGLSGNGEVEDNIMSITCPTVTLSPTTVTTPTVGTAYSQTLTAAGSSTTFTYAVTSGTLPAGLSLSSAGVLSGTPSSSAAASFTVTATGANTCAVSQAYTVTPLCPSLTLSPATPSTPTVGTAYSQTFTTTGVSTTFTYAVTSGTLPAGLALSSAGVLSGTPTSNAAATFTVTATGANGCTTSKSYTVTPVCPAITIGQSSLPQGTVGTAYSQTLSATGGTSPYGTWAITTGTLPSGLSLNASTGAITGTPTASASPATTLTVSVNDTYNCQGTKSITLQICPVVSISPATLPTPTVGTAYSQSITASGGSGTYTYTVSGGALPSWATLSSSGVLSGTPNSTTAATFTVKATDANGCASTLSYTVTPVCPTITIGQSALPQGTVGTAYSTTLSATGGTAPYGTWTLTTGTLPTGLTLNASTGVISGTPTASASPATTLTVTVKDTYGCQGSKSITLQICPVITVSPAALSTATAGTAYSQTLAGSGGATPYTFTVSSGALPAWATLSSAGVLSGTPNSTTAATFTVKATDANGCSGTLSYTLTPVCPTITLSPAALPQGTVGTAYSTTLGATGGTAPYASWTITSGTLPAGLSLNASTGVISGTPTASASPATTLTVQATDSNGCQGSKSITLQICPAITLSPATPATGTVGTAYSQTFTASGGTSAYVFAIASGTLPTGLGLNTSTGVVSGTPTTQISSNVTLRVTDANGCSSTLAVTFAISCPVITLAPATLPAGLVGTAYSQTVSASGGSSSYTYAISSGTLPAGLSLNTGSGVISGTPTTSNGAGVSITVSATDSFNCSGTRTYNLQVCPVISLTPSTLTAATVGTAYSQTITASGGATPYTYTVSSGTLPTWASLTSAGVLSGTPSTTTAATFTVKATDANGCSGTLSYTLTPACPTITIGQSSLPQGTVGSAYSTTLSASGGTAPYGTWTLTSGTLPAGLTLNASTGVISGTPTASASPATTLTLRVNDTYGCQGSKSITLQICPVVTLAPATLTPPVVGTAYSQTFTSSGGTSPYTYTVSSGTLPTWATLTSAGAFSGTPNSTTAATFTVKTTDANGCATTTSYTVTPACPTISITPAASAQGIVGTAYSQTLTASGGTAPYGTWTVTSGTLPAGLSLNASTGVISGTPTTSNGAGTTFTVRATDTYGCQGTQVVSLQICPVITISPTTPATPTVSTAYSQTLTSSGGATPYTYTVSSGTLPTWATLSSGGVLSGTPDSPNSVTFTVKSTDANGCSATQSYTITPVCPTLTISPLTAATGTVGTAYSQTLSGSGGTAPYASWTVTSGTLPAGLSLSTAGVISGTPTASTGAATTFTVRTTDAHGCQATATIALKICPVITLSPTTMAASTAGASYSQTVSASGGVTPYVYAVSSGTLPAGLSLNSSTGVLSGTPTSTASATFTLSATDANGCPGTRSYTMTPACQTISLSPATLAAATVNTAYSQTVSSSGGLGTVTYSISSGTLPAGLTLNASSGIISGTPTSTAAATFTVKATDVNGCTGTLSYTVTPACPVITITPATLATGGVGVAYSQTMTPAGGIAPYSSWTVTSGTLPAGLSLNASTGVISGTPTASNGTGVNVTLRVTDANGCQGSVVASIKICPVITQSPATLTAPVVGMAYTQAISGVGGVSPYTFTVTSGSLPAGLTLGSNGTFSGAATSTTTATFTVKATASDGCSGTASYTLTPVCPTLTLTPASLPLAYLGTAFNQALAAGGGTAPYTYTLQSGDLPSGVLLASNGVISGTPAAIGSFPITVTATDTYGCRQSFSLTMQVLAFAVGNLVFEDSNNNGLLDPGEPGVANATVQLFNPGSDNAIGGTGTAADTQVGSSLTTDSTGSYLFSSLPSGNYYVEVTPPPDYLYTGGTPDTQDDYVDNNNDGAQPGGPGTPLFSPIINLSSSQSIANNGNLTVDFGLWSSVAVGNMIFIDINGDGHRNEGESLGGIYVELYAQGATPGVDTPVSVGTSGCSCKGRYYLDGLNPGTYFLHIPASQFAAGMPLQGLLPMSSVVPGDDDVGQDLIFNNNPAVNGTSTATFSLHPGFCPVGAAESGAEGSSDDAIDARVDLTRDLGVVAPSGTGFAASEAIRRYIVTGGFVASVPAGATTFATWNQDGTLGGPLDDPDQDGMTNLMEYALGTDPASPLQPTRFTLTHDASGSLTALLTVPTATHYDLIVSLETLNDITQSANATAWKKLSMATTTTINTDGTLTHGYPTLENLLVFKGLNGGFIRLHVDLDANRDGIPEATVYSPIQGWGRQSFATGSRTFSTPLLNPSFYSGLVAAVSGGEVMLPYIITLPSGSFYLEALDGSLAGQQFDIDATASSGNTVVLQGSQDFSGLTGAHIAIRPHHTLADLLPATAFGSDDRVLFFDPVAGNYTTLTNSGAGTWLSSDSLGMNARPFAAHEAALVQIRDTGAVLMYTGEVRQISFATPLVAGTQLIATSGWPVLSLAPVTGLSPGTTPDTADRFRIWDGDTTPTATDYTGYYLDGTTTPPAWLPQTAPAPDPYLLPFHGYFLIRTAPGLLQQAQPW
jgi:SdrD B-like domain/Putative Ig domain/GEVED domain